jgi:hypothetical protein
LIARPSQPIPGDIPERWRKRQTQRLVLPAAKPERIHELDAFARFYSGDTDLWRRPK